MDQPRKRKPTRKNNKVVKVVRYTAKITNGLNKGAQSFRYMPKTYTFAVPSRGTTVVGIRTAKSWVLRIDGKHGKVKTPHVNINPMFTKVRDPHTKISASVFKGAERVTKVFQKINKVAIPIAIACDASRIGYAMYKDKGLGRNTAVATTSAASGWAGGFAGGWAGGQSGALVGTSVGTLFGPVGAGIGVAIGAITGGFVGAISGSLALDHVSGKVVKKCIEVIDREEQRKKPSFPLKDSNKLCSQPLETTVEMRLKFVALKLPFYRRYTWEGKIFRAREDKTKIFNCETEIEKKDCHSPNLLKIESNKAEILRSKGRMRKCATGHSLRRRSKYHVGKKVIYNFAGNNCSEQKPLTNNKNYTFDDVEYETLQAWEIVGYTDMEVTMMVILREFETNPSVRKLP